MHDLNPDPLIGLAVLQRSSNLSKAVFWNRIVPQLPVIQLSTRRKAVRLSDWNAFLDARTVKAGTGR